MSVKRLATTELNHENWDKEDPSEHEEMGKFKAATREVLEKRVIKQARRRNPAASEEHQKSIFSGFGGFQKAQPSSFDFLKNLTNGSNTNGSPTSKSDITVPIQSSVFGKETVSEAPSKGLFSAAPISTAMTFGSLQKSPIQGTLTSSTGMSSVFQTAKTDNLVTNTPFKIQKANVIEPKNEIVNPGQTNPAVSQPNSSIGSLTTTTSKVFTNSAAPLETKKSTSNEQEQSIKNCTESTNESELSEHKRKYYTQLKLLNESVSDWIKTHVEATPLCILTPVFKDYENHFKIMKDEFDEMEKKMTSEPRKTSENDSFQAKDTPFSVNNNKPSLLSSDIPKTQTEESKEEKTGFSFGIKPAATTTTTSAGFTFGINTGSVKPFQMNTSSPFSLSTTTTTETSASAPFSFGIGKPFSFNSTVQKPVEPTNKDENTADEDEPPKVEFNKIEEENSVFDKKCKIFVKKDGNFADRGVGTLYIKKIENSEKHQLLVRANTSLGNILINLVLSSGIPIQRMGKNNVMLVCIPTPESNPPPTPILVRVKTAEEADELLETLNKYKA